jgi:prepilin-type N-terminal cleavage/methylation domain-containing protein
MSRWSTRIRAAFTIIELLVVLGIITVLMALALPAIQLVRAEADKTRCRNHLRQIGEALHHYHAGHKRLPAHGGSRPGWVVQILPELEQESLYKHFDKSKDWREPNNAVAVGTHLRVMQCPSAERDREVTGTFNGVPYLAAGGDYVTFLSSQLPGLPPSADRAGALSPGKTGKGRAFEELIDGMSATLLVGECTGASAWADAAMVFDPPSGSPPINSGNFNALYAPHKSGAQAVMADGAVRFLRANVSVEIVSALVTFAGREFVDLSALE